MYRISELIQVGQKVYHTNDLAVLWGIASKNTLYKTISRYVARGILFPVYKGLYSLVPMDSLNPLDLGRSIIHAYTYLTTESVLAQAGIISQGIYDYTFAASQSKRVSAGQWIFRYRQLKDIYLHNPKGILYLNGGFVATVERAIADMLYFNPRYHFDLHEAIDFKKVRALQKEIGYPC
jgi:predicted transcriptional regulator of viral defense system